MKKSVNSDGHPYHLYQQKNVFPRPEAVPAYPTLYVVVFIVVSDFKVRGGCLLISMEMLTIMAQRLSFHNHISHKIVKYRKVSLTKHIPYFVSYQHGTKEII